MRIKSSRRIVWAQIALPGNWREMVRDVASSAAVPPVEETGDVSLPLVRRAGGKWEIVLGLKHAAAMHAGGVKELTCHVLECTNAQAETLRSADRGNEMVSKAAAELVQLLTRKAQQEAPPRPKRAKEGRPKTVRGLMLELVTEELGVSPDAVRKAEQRARQRVAAELPDIWDFRIEQQADWLKYANDVRVACIQAQDHVRIALRAIQSLDAYGIERLQHIGRLLQEAGQRLVDSRPLSVCPYCKNRPGIVESCPACVREGWVGQLDHTRVPHELLTDDPLSVSNNGRIERLLVAQKEPSAMRLPRGELRAQEADGLEGFL